MRIVRIRPRHFRGFADGGWIDLEGEIVLFFGPNGSGKTSLSEAIEWLLFGATTRRLKGDAYSRTEYQGSYRNVHALSHQITDVTAVIRLSTGAEHEIRRELTMAKNGGDLESHTYVDGTKASFGSLGLEAARDRSPVIAQHGLQDFIHTNPKDRRDWISAALGLEPIVDFKTHLERFRNSLRSTPPETVVRAFAHIRKVQSGISELPLLPALQKRWNENRFDLAHDYQEIKKTCLDYLKQPEALNLTFDETVERLVGARNVAERSVFDGDTLRPRDDVPALLGAVKTHSDASLEELAELKHSVSDFLSLSDARYSQALLTLWEQGLQVANSDDNLCPLCESPTLGSDKRITIQHRLTENSLFIQTNNAISDYSSKVARRVGQMLDAATAIRPPLLGEEEREALFGVCGQNQSLDEFLLACDRGHTNHLVFMQQLAEAAQLIGNIPTQVGAVVNVAHAVESIVQVQSLLADCPTRLAQIAKEHQHAWSLFRPTLEARVAAESTVREADALLGLLGVYEHVKLASVFQDYIDGLLEDIRWVEAFLQKKQEEVLATKGQEIKAWYDLMNPGADIGYKGMEPATNAIKLLAESFSAVMSAPACLSQSQLNCLGLSVRFMRLTSSPGSIKFLCIDDPVQSMDDDHTETFIVSVIPKLLQDHGLQLIILSHLRRFVDRIREVNLDRLPLVYAVEGYTQAGPVISQYSLDKEFANLKALAKMNEEQRRIATENVRVLTERILREAYLRITGSPMNQSLDDAGAKALLAEFARLAKLSQSELSGLADTVNFSSPSHHAEVGWQVPSTSHLTPHIDRLVTLSKKLGLV